MRCSLLCSLYALSTFYDLLFMIACIALYNAVATYFSFTAQHTWLISWRKYKLDTIFSLQHNRPLTWSGLGSRLQAAPHPDVLKVTVSASKVVAGDPRCEFHFITRHKKCPCIGTFPTTGSCCCPVSRLSRGSLPGSGKTQWRNFL